MKITPYPAVTQARYEAIVREWVDLINNQESGIWIWPPLYAPYRRIWQFQRDFGLQRKVFGSKHKDHLLIHIDLEQRENVTKGFLHELIKENLAIQGKVNEDKKKPLITILEELTNKKKIVNLFVTGADYDIRKGRFEVIEELNYLAQTNWNVHVLLCVETDITHPDFYSHFTKRTTLSQNITIAPYYSKEDAESFIKFVCYNWKVKLSQEIKKWIEEHCGTHYLLIKDVIRNVRKNPKLKARDIDTLPSLHTRAEVIIQNHLQDERKVLMAVLNKKTINASLIHSKNFLIKQSLLREKRGRLEITVPFLAEYLKKQEKDGTKNIQANILIFTNLELKVYEFFNSNTNKIIPREKIAEIIWEENWEEHYSDWAIDQLIHRIRTKIHSMEAPYELVTKKGVGFLLLQK